MTTPAPQSYYEVLAVSPDADLLQIKKAYREKILHAHPDKASSTGSSAIDGAHTSSSVSLIKEAYDTLSDAASREQYDIDLVKTVQTQGFNLNGDGLDSYSLESFDFDEAREFWMKNCPRCQAPSSIKLTEQDLEQGTDDGEGGLELVVQCGSCSLWIKVKYMEEEDS